MHKNANSISDNTTNTQPWYAVRTFNCQEQKVSDFLTDKGYNNFIPMTLSQEKGDEKNPKQIRIPAVHNLLFIQRKETPEQLIKDLSECHIPTNIFRHPGEKKLCEISDLEMVELRMLCDPSFQTSTFISHPEAEAMIGKEVRVVAGPFKGSTGRLVRKNKQYYFLKSVIGMGVMVRISRWYCEPINNTNK